jgi:hypothetical protein
MKPQYDDPFDDPSYQAWLSSTARTCRARDKPCDGCQAGRICDGWLGFNRYEDDEPERFDVYDIDENGDSDDDEG